MPADPTRTAPSWPRPWQRHPLFRFFASLQLAMILLAVLILASIAGTLYESGFDANVARAYIYDTWWFNIWLCLLATNLAVVAFSRMPWKKHHTGFLLTHLGIIMLLAGAMIGRIWGIEGSITLFQGQPPASRLLIDARQLTFMSDAGNQAVPFDILRRQPTREKPWLLFTDADGTRFEAIGFSNDLQTLRDAIPDEKGGPAIFADLKNPATGQALSGWIFSDNPKQNTLNMGLAGITLQRNPEPLPAAKPKAAPLAVNESILAFENKPGEQISHAHSGTASGLQVGLRLRDGKRELLVANGTKLDRFDLAQKKGKSISIPGTDLKFSVEEFWPDFAMRDGKPATLSDQPNNPVVMIRVQGSIPAPEPESETKNWLTLWPAKNGYGYLLTSHGTHKTGILQPGETLPTGWSSWELAIPRSFSAATMATHFEPASKTEEARPSESTLSGPLIRAVQGKTAIEQWIPLGWKIRFHTEKPVDVIYGLRSITLPFGMELTRFDVERNPGTSDPASFKSTLLITAPDGTTATGSCWMNNPMNYPNAWWRSLTGLTYKMSQASWNPENLQQSSVQILRDPGWLFKWLGSLLICIGIYTLFYLRPYPKKGGLPENPLPKETR